ncbi:MAG: TIGR02221 family CRISPR-associated protein [Magnetococcales bacterium]|nr:TIGR02221 family CRISPR-associated protein [Magnetococcales bacterium]
MSHLLISFLGRASREVGSGYHRATYRFADGQEVITPFFGLALANQLQPKRLVLLGTASSMWDVLFDELDPDNAHETIRLELLEAIDAQRVEQPLLDRLSEVMRLQTSRDCTLLLIPFGRDSQEQTAILRTLAEQVQQGDQVDMDLTHGFRHLPMLGLLSALYLRTVRQAVVRGLFYGALQMAEAGATPVLRLDGLLEIADWISAVDRYDQCGDYGVFAPLLQRLEQASEPVADLQEAAFHERINDVSQARNKLLNFYRWLKDTPLSVTAELFRATLQERIHWCRALDRATREAHLARQYFRQRDYLRSTIFAFESQVTREMSNKRLGDPGNFSEREKVAKEMREKNSAFQFLNHLRNTLAHGLKEASEQVKKAMASEQVLRQSLDQLLKGPDGRG